MLAFPFVLRRAEALEALPPQRKEHPEIGRRSCRGVLQVPDRTRQRPDALKLFDRADNHVGAIAKRRRQVHTRNVLRDARPRVDSKHLFDELVMAYRFFANDIASSTIRGDGRAGFQPDLALVPRVINVSMTESFTPSSS